MDDRSQIKIPKRVIDALIRFRVPGEQMQVLLYIVSQTLGRDKNRAAISLSQFQKATGINKRNVLRAVDGLVEKNLIDAIKDNGSAKTYRLNKNYSSWNPMSKKTLSKKTTPLSKKTLSKKTTPLSKKTTPTTESTRTDQGDFASGIGGSIGKIIDLHNKEKQN